MTKILSNAFDLEN